MKKKSSEQMVTPSLPLIAVNEMLKAIKGRLGATYPTLARIAGPGRATLHNWTEGERAEQIEALIRLLARLPRDERHRIIDSACPCFPSLDHPYIARDRMLAESLRDLLRNQTGLTVVVGESDYARTFLATALAHSLAAQNPNRIVVTGFDVHKPNWHVPIEGVTYLNAWKRPNGLDVNSKQLSVAPLVFLNGVYSRAPGIRAEVQKLSARCHVLIVEGAIAARDLALFQYPRHIVTVSVYPSGDVADDAARMIVTIGEIPQKDNK